MWVWITAVLVLAVAAALAVGLQRVDTERQIGPDEGIEDTEVTRGYDKISQWPQFKMIRLLIIRELRKHHPGGVLADIGCGPGYLITEILKKLPELTVIGVDISTEMIEQAEANLSRLGFSGRVSFRQGDIHDLPLEDGSLDFVVTTLSMHHWSDPAKAISEVYRVLKPGGGYLIFDLRRDCPRIFYWVLKFAQAFILPASMGRINEPTASVLASYTAAELREILAGTPFKEDAIKQGIIWSFVSAKKQ
jgi:ubiquinone/menaquinone biosynthesis C-methylase UbiE